MIGVNRRSLLAALPASLLLGARGGWAQALDAGAFTSDPFALGVASGDPLPDGFVIWTRLAPDPLSPGGGLPAQPLKVRWEVATDDKFTSIVRNGEAIAFPQLAHAVHVEVAGLAPGRPHWYRFTVGTERSAQGRACTAPPPGSMPDTVRIGVIGCQHYETGRFHAHRFLARDEPDLIFHYGDYIYEGRGEATMFDRPSGETVATVRRHLGDACVSLEDYRRRYAQYKLDPALQAAHAAAPWICTWDDHEVVNNWTGDTDGAGTPSEIFALRRLAAAQAMYEHLPLRRAAFPGPTMRLFREIRWGELLDLRALDTRLYRSALACGTKMARPCDEVFSAARSMIGSAQQSWLEAGVVRSTASWFGLAQQVMMASLDRGNGSEIIWNMDSWAGYAAARDRLLGVAAAHERRIVVLTGDEHRNLAIDVRREADRSDARPDAVEFVCTSASSGGDGLDQRNDAARLREKNPGLHFVNDQRGYMLCDISAQAWQTRYRVLDSVRGETAQCRTRTQFTIEPDFTLSQSVGAA